MQLSVQSKTLNWRARWNSRFARSLTNGDNLDKATSGEFRPFCTETALVDLQRPNPRLERRPRNPESRRCPRRPEHPPAGGAQGVLHDRLLVAGQRARQPEPTLAGLSRW